MRVVSKKEQLQLQLKTSELETVYSFGLDPIWYVYSNELLFFNSFKIKISVILVLQMFTGTYLKGVNVMYFGEKYDFLFEFLPIMDFRYLFLLTW